MVSSHKFLSSAAVLFSVYIQLTQAFCVYNELEGEGSSLYVYNDYHYERSFKKNIAQGGKECCPYDNSDCNPGLSRESTMELHFVFTFQNDTTASERLYTVYCEGGAGVTITGSSVNNLVSHCVKANGIDAYGALQYYARA